jgi:hypothetical protein
MSGLCKCTKPPHRRLVGEGQLDDGGLEKVGQDSAVGHKTSELCVEPVAQGEVLDTAVVIKAQGPRGAGPGRHGPVRVIVCVLPKGGLVHMQCQSRIAS